MTGKLCLGVAFLVSLSLPALAGDLDPASLKMVHDYQLTMPKVKAYEAAYESLKAASTTDPSLKADYQAASGEKTKSMADEVAKMTHHPKTYAFFAKQGLSKEDAVTLPLALMGGCMVAQYPTAAKGLADQTSAQQADFCKQNQPVISKMKFFSGG
jgi:hypothetical protein